MKFNKIIIPQMRERERERGGGKERAGREKEKARVGEGGRRKS